MSRCADTQVIFFFLISGDGVLCRAKKKKIKQLFALYPSFPLMIALYYIIRVKPNRVTCSGSAVVVDTLYPPTPSYISAHVAQINVTTYSTACTREHSDDSAEHLGTSCCIAIPGVWRKKLTQ